MNVRNFLTPGSSRASSRRGSVEGHAINDNSAHKSNANDAYHEKYDSDGVSRNDGSKRSTLVQFVLSDPCIPCKLERSCSAVLDYREREEATRGADRATRSVFSGDEALFFGNHRLSFHLTLVYVILIVLVMIKMATLPANSAERRRSR
jgi:hypothetical protein